MKSILLDKFTRVNNKAKSDILRPDELVTLEDAVLDYRLGKPIKRGNFSRYDAGVDAGNDILKMTDVLVSGSTFYIIATTDTILSYYDPSTNLWSGIAGTYTSGFKFNMEHYKDKFIFVFDTDDEPRMIDSGTLGAWDLDLGVADVSTIESFHDAGGNLTQNTAYRWVMVGVTDDGQFAPPSRPFTHFVNTNRIHATDSTATVICFTSLPYIDDSRITSRMIFRNKASNDIQNGTYKTSEVYYHVATLDNDSNGTDYQTEWEDNIGDSDLDSNIVIYTNMPTRANYITQNKDRIFLANFTQVDRNFISPPSSFINEGTHTGSNDAAVLTDSNASWATNVLVGRTIYNITDGSSGTVTSNTATTVTCSGGLSGGTDDDWDTGDTYDVSAYPTITTVGTYVYTDATDKGEMIVITDNGGGAGSLNDSTQYDYKIAYMDRRGRLSKHYHELSITTDAGTGADDHTVTISGIGVLDNITALEFPVKAVYRQTGGTGDFYLIVRNDARDIGNVIDSGLANKTETWSDPATNTTAHPSRVVFSDIESPSAFRDESYVDVYPEDGDVITGIFDDFDGVIVFKEKSICKVFTGGSPLNWNRIKLSENVGCSEPETLQKRGDTYYFIYQNKCYRYRYGAQEPEDIGLLNQTELDTITTWYDSTINDEWYIIQCSDGSKYYTFVYDLKLETWYYFNRQTSNGEVFKALHVIRYGTDKGTILSASDGYLTQYNQPTVAARVDSETGSNVDITPIIKTGNIKFPDGISLARLRRLKFDYKKVASKSTTILLTDEDTGTTKSLTDSTSSGKRLYESDIGAAADSLKKVRSISVRISGAGLEEWDNLRIDYRPIREGNQVGN